MAATLMRGLLPNRGSSLRPPVFPVSCTAKGSRRLGPGSTRLSVLPSDATCDDGVFGQHVSRPSTLDTPGSPAGTSIRVAAPTGPPEALRRVSRDLVFRPTMWISFRLTGPPEAEPKAAGALPRSIERSSDAVPFPEAAGRRPVRLPRHRARCLLFGQRRIAIDEADTAGACTPAETPGHQLRRLQHATRGLRQDHPRVRVAVEGRPRRPERDLPGVLRGLDHAGRQRDRRLRSRRRRALAGPRRATRSPTPASSRTTGQDAPDKGMVSTSVVVFDVRPGNPHGIADWDDLTAEAPRS